MYLHCLESCVPEVARSGPSTYVDIQMVHLTPVLACEHLTNYAVIVQWEREHF